MVAEADGRRLACILALLSAAILAGRPRSLFLARALVPRLMLPMGRRGGLLVRSMRRQLLNRRRCGDRWRRGSGGFGNSLHRRRLNYRPVSSTRGAMVLAPTAPTRALSAAAPRSFVSRRFACFAPMVEGSGAFAG